MPFARHHSRAQARDAAWWRDNHGFAGRFDHNRHRSSPRLRLWLPVFISFVVQIPPVFFIWSGAGVGPRARFEPRTFSGDLLADLAISLVGPIALIFARKFPGPVAAIVGLAASADLLISQQSDGPPYISLAFAVGSAVVRGARIWAWASIAGSWAATIVIAMFVGLNWQPLRIVGVTIGILLLLGAAEAVRGRREHEKQIRATIARRRQSEVQAERVRIARELHDVLAHSLSQINVQAGVGLHLMDKQPEKAAAALASIKETSKTALDEVRSVLGVLRSEDAPLLPEPDLSRLETLVASASTHGLDARLELTASTMPQSTQLAIYRIVQESLTNVARHSKATTVRIAVGETDREFTIDIRDDGNGASDARDERDNGGRGLLGMRERAELLGGTLDAGPHPEGGFEVRARFPKKEATE